jgi:hypothetical protein
MDGPYSLWMALMYGLMYGPQAHGLEVVEVKCLRHKSLDFPKQPNPVAAPFESFALYMRTRLSPPPTPLQLPHNLSEGRTPPFGFAAQPPRANRKKPAHPPGLPLLLRPPPSPNSRAIQPHPPPHFSTPSIPRPLRTRVFEFFTSSNPRFLVHFLFVGLATTGL